MGLLLGGEDGVPLYKLLERTSVCESCSFDLDVFLEAKVLHLRKQRLSADESNLALVFEV